MPGESARRASLLGLLLAEGIERERLDDRGARAQHARSRHRNRLEHLPRVALAPQADDEDDETLDNEEAPAVAKKLYVLVNPEIVEKSEELVLGIEGCLSVPELVGEVERHEKITVKALNRHGHPIKIKAEGWLARIFQHEIDHLEGIIYTDRTDKVWKPRDDEEIPLD